MSPRNSVHLSELVGRLYLNAGTYQQLPVLLGVVNHATHAHATHLELDTGQGYLHEHFGKEGMALACDDARVRTFVKNVRRRVQLVCPGTRPPLQDLGVDSSCQPPGTGLPVTGPQSSEHVGPDSWMDLRPLTAGVPGLRAAPRSAIAVIRDVSLPAFTAHERNMLTQLTPHLSQALSLTHQLETARRNEASAWEVLEHMSQGALLLEANGGVIHANANAERLLNQSHAVRFPPMHFVTPGLNDRFEAALRQASDPLHPRPTAISLSAADEAEALVMTVLPVPRQWAWSSLTAVSMQVLVILRTSQARTVHLSEHVLPHFGLTPAEFRLCNALASGMRLKVCAQAWDLAYDTLRVQLKRIFEKTGVHRQAELLVLLDAFRETQ